MRIPRAIAAVTAVVLMTVVGCTNQVAGTATPDPAQPPLARSKDGSGIVAGYPDAPVQIEIYTEPQCNHCAELQKAFGDDLERYINLGQLAVTYRPLTFLDPPGDTNGYSARIVNALFSAVGPATATEQPKVASGPEFQRFVEQLWGHQDRGGPGPSDTAMQQMATEAGMPADVAERIGSGKPAAGVDVTAVADANFGFLVQVDPLSAGTPTVFDLNKNDKVDIYNDNWLSKLLSSA